MKAIFGDDFRPFDRGIVNEKIEEMNSHSDEFEKLLKRFTAEGFEVVEQEESLPDNADMDDYDDEINLDDFPKGSVHKIEDLSFPDGKIEQNQNISVKVEILHPIANPGLQSRFPNRFEFADFTIDELLEITRRRVKEYEYEFTDSAWDKYCQILTQAYQQRNPQTWGNARFVANQLERIYIQHAMRCVKQAPTDKRQLRLLTPEDILPIDVSKEKRHIGFC